VFLCCRIVPATTAELNAANLAVDVVLAATNNFTSRINVVNASVSAIAALDNHDLQIAQLNDTRAYCFALSLGYSKFLFIDIYFASSRHSFQTVQSTASAAVTTTQKHSLIINV